MFIQACRRDKVKLQVKVHCNAFLQDLSNVLQQFNATKMTAEESYLSALLDHYTTAKAKMNQQLAELERTKVAKAALVSAEERSEHEYLMAKTRQIIETQAEAGGKKERQPGRSGRKETAARTRPSPTGATEKRHHPHNKHYMQSTVLLNSRGMEQLDV